MRAVVGVQLGKNALHAALDGVLGDAELIANLLIGISGGDEPQHREFCRGQGLIADMLRDLELDLG
jgi:hypothetical protein